MINLACNYNDYNVKCKNKYNSQQIQKKFKNKHHYRYNDINKKHLAKINRINHQKATKIIDFNLKTKSLKKQQRNMSMQNHYKISVDISLIQNKTKHNIFHLDHSKYRIIPCILKTAMIKVHDKHKKVFYLSYCFCPCRHFYNEKPNGDALYHKRDDVYISLLFDHHNRFHSKYNLNHTFNDKQSININQPLFNIAQKCFNERNSSDIDYTMLYDWNISDVKYINNIINITVSTTVYIKNELDANKFTKSRPFSKRMMNSLNIFDADQREILKCQLSTKGHNIYSNVPLILDENIVSTKTFLIKHFDKLKNVLIPPQTEKKKIQKYWFCRSCFMMNEYVETQESALNVIYECIQCKQTVSYGIKWYYEAYVNDNVFGKYERVDVTLTKTESKAVHYVKRFAKKASTSSSNSLLNKIKKLHPHNVQGIYDKLLDFMAEKVPLIIHVKTNELIPKLLRDTHYRNLFEVGTGNGCTNQQTRTKYEAEMFPSIYGKVTSEKPKYGCLNIGLQPAGCRLAKRYGTSYFTLKNETVRWRVSYTNQDSFHSQGYLGTLNNCQHLLNSLGEYELKELCSTAANGKLGGYQQTKYREIQIHGSLLLNRDIQSLHVPKTEQSNEIYQQFAYKNACKLIWF